MSIEQSLTASVMEGLAMILWGSGTSGRYLTFSWKWLMSSVSFWGPVLNLSLLLNSFEVSGRLYCSSNTHIWTSLSKRSGCSAVFSATTLAIVEPLLRLILFLLFQVVLAYQFPDPTTQTLCFLVNGVKEDI